MPSEPGISEWHLWLRDAGAMSVDVSPFGVFDMAGNVEEWVQDPIHDALPAELFAFQGGCDVVLTARATRGTCSMNCGDDTLDSFNTGRSDVGRAFPGFRLAVPLSGK